MWCVLHGLAEMVLYDAIVRLRRGAAPSGAAQQLARLLRTLPALLPCRMCRENLAEHVRSWPVPDARLGGARDAEALVGWVCDAHNAVNRSRGAPVVARGGGIVAVVRGMWPRQAVQFVRTHAATVERCIDECVAERNKLDPDRAAVRAAVAWRREYADAMRALLAALDAAVA
jgi:hypothetical protein